MVWICTKISIHAPTRGATPGARTLDTLIKNFNPRSHEGSDRDVCGYDTAAKISIHAPTRGATIAFSVFSVPLRNFNPRSHEGSDNADLNMRSSKQKFQSTLPRGERLWQGFTAEYNPIISIHAPTRGATTDSSKAVGADIISIHAPTRGATIAFSVFSVPLRNFNPRSHEGSDNADLNMRSSKQKFQSTLPRGERQGKDRSNVNLGIFQSTLPRGERQRTIWLFGREIRFQSTLPRGERQ